jgi:hypothetical protein
VPYAARRVEKHLKSLMAAHLSLTVGWSFDQMVITGNASFDTMRLSKYELAAANVNMDR